MPEFVLNLDGDNNVPAYEHLPALVQGYIEALFFTESNEMFDSAEWNSPTVQKALEEGTVSGSIPKDAGYADLDPATLAEILADCKAFEESAADLLAIAYTRGDYDEIQAGRDFWFTRNGHGVGFWDRQQLDADGLGDRLSKRARKFGNTDSYWGDDGSVYLA